MSIVGCRDRSLLESLSTEERETNLVDRMELRLLEVTDSNPFMPSLELS